MTSEELSFGDLVAVGLLLMIAILFGVIAARSLLGPHSDLDAPPKRRPRES